MKRCNSEAEIVSKGPKYQTFNEKDAAVRESGEIEFPLSDELLSIPFPDELLSEIIFKYIPLYRWSSCLEYVSKQFQRCVVIAYQEIKSISIAALFPAKSRAEIMEHSSHTEIIEPYSIFFPEKRFRKLSSEWLSESLQKLLLVCPTLTELKGFDCMTDTLSVEICYLLKKFDCLQSIYFVDMHIPSLCLANFSTNWKSLKTLHFMDCHSPKLDSSNQYDVHRIKAPLDITSIENIAVSNGRLANETIYYRYPRCKDIRSALKSTGLEEKFHLKNYGEKLTSLKLTNLQMLYHTCIDAEQFAITCPNLQSLTLELFNDVDDGEFLLKLLPKLHKLTNVSFSVEYVESDSFIHDLCISMNSLANRFESFEIKFDANITYRELETFLFTKCVHLRCLKLHTYCSLNEINELPRLSVTLEKLEIYSLLDQHSMLLQNVLQLSNLTDLNINGSSTHPWQDLPFLENLRHLKLPGDVITDSILQLWDTKVNGGMFKQLVSLKINSCSGISDAGACFLAKKAINLEILEMMWSRVSDVTILTLANTAKKLKFVNFIQREPLLIGCEAILKLIEKSVYLKKMSIAKNLAIDLVKNKDFLPYVGDVVIDYN